MCGLAGLSAKYVQDKHKKVFQELMLGACLRGFHSAGLGVVTKNHNDKYADFAVDKTVGNPFDLFGRKAADDLIKRHAMKAMIGHCRSATVGSISRSNAHPFITDTRLMIGCHNGTIRGTQENEKFYGTDSECLLNNIDDKGIENVLPNTLGAWALTYFDAKDQTLNLIRNKERTLYVAVSAKDNEVYWTSEEGLLKWVLDRNNIKYDDIVLLAPNVLVSIDICSDDPLSKGSVRFTNILGKEESRSVASTSHFPEATIEEGTKETTKTEQTEVTSNGSFETQTPVLLLTDETGRKKTETGQTGSTQKTEENISTSATSVGVPLIHKTYGGKNVSRGRFQEILNMGCVNCEAISHVGDAVHFYADNVYLCEECHSKPMVQKTVETRIGEYIEDAYDEACLRSSVEQHLQVCN